MTFRIIGLRPGVNVLARKREEGQRWGCVGVKGKGVKKKGMMCLFPLMSA